LLIIASPYIDVKERTGKDRKGKDRKGPERIQV